MNSLSNILRQIGSGLAVFIEREAGHIVILVVLIWWSCQIMQHNVEFGQRLADQAIGALLYAMNIRRQKR
jgi:hypothetical protein